MFEGPSFQSTFTCLAKVHRLRIYAPNRLGPSTCAYVFVCIRPTNCISLSGPAIQLSAPYCFECSTGQPFKLSAYLYSLPLLFVNLYLQRLKFDKSGQAVRGQMFNWIGSQVKRDQIEATLTKGIVVYPLDPIVRQISVLFTPKQ